MKSSTRFFLVLLLCIGSGTPDLASEKKNYDLNTDGTHLSGAMDKSIAAGYRGWELRRNVSELAVLPGGYFTLGTTGGLSSNTLDQRCTITFGHPYAYTSYPLVYLDGTWDQLPRLCVVDTTNPVISGDSIVLAYRLTGSVEVRFTVLMENEGTDATFSLRMTNNDVVAHSFGLGFVLDPALGPCGDGIFQLNQSRIPRDTLFSAASFVGADLTIAERASTHQGMKLALGFPETTPNATVVSNWNDTPGYDLPALPPSAPQLLYDLVVKMYWLPISVSPQGTVTSSFRMSLKPPDFGSSVYMRWDLPQFLGMQDGVMFPKDIPTTVTLTNLTSSARGQGYLQCALPPEIPLSNAPIGVVLGPSATGYGHIGFSTKEIYEDRVASFTLTYTENGVTVDSLVRTLLVPSTPVSDTGLTVTIDSLAAGNFPSVSLILEAERTSTHQRVFSLSRDNVFLYENGGRIQDFALGPDTSGGVHAMDIVFVLDVTGSMADEIAGVKSNIIEFTDSLAMQGVDFRLGMVTFLDAIENVYDFTSNPELFKQYVSGQYAHAGDDEPENSLDALQRASELSFRDQASRLFIWITDATYHQADAFTQRTAAQVVDRLLSLDITVDAIGPTYNLNGWYAPIIDPTGGKFFDIGGNFRDILLDISRGRSSGRFMISYQAPASPPGTRQVKVELHTAGRGGFALADYTAPGSGQGSFSGVQCYPNPFNPQVTFRINLPRSARADITIFNVLGQQVRNFAIGPASGMTEFTWNGTDASGKGVSSGIYFVRCTVLGAGDRIVGSDMVKLIHLK